MDEHLYRANFGDGTWTKGYPDIRDAKLAIWGRAAIVQYRSYIQRQTASETWETVQPSAAMRNGPPITAIPGDAVCIYCTGPLPAGTVDYCSASCAAMADADNREDR